MEKKLPRVYANSLNEIHNNNTVFYSADQRGIEYNENDINQTRELKGNTIEQKINSIFNSPNYIYKAEVELTLDSGTVVKKVIGKNRNNLITMDNELIPINIIKDIKYK